MAQIALSFEEHLFTFKFTEHKLKKNIREQISFSTISGIVTFILLLFTNCFIMLTLFRYCKISPDKECLWSNCDLKASISSLLINEKLSDIERRRQTVRTGLEVNVMYFVISTGRFRWPSSGEHLVTLFQSLGYSWTERITNLGQSWENA